MTTTTAQRNVIDCADLVRIYRGDGVEVQALQGLTLRVAEGDIVAMVGASGSGKSTLLGILSGLDRPSAGRATVAGFDLTALSSGRRLEYRRNAVGFVWQQTERNLLPYLTARENVELPMLFAGRAEREKRAGELLRLLEVDAHADRRPGQLSGGEQQRVAIAVALANGPQVLLADEPTGELDEAMSAEVLEAIRAVNEQLGVTALIVTHDPAVSEHVHRTVQIRDGRTSTEVHRDTDRTGAETFTVIDSVGRLQLPTDYVHRLGIRELVRLTLEDDHVRVQPGEARGSEKKK
ncbi:MAG TPA: ABC transporter ATP-binding protein [Pseudolysinimonas sp.]|jgi:ABC-type lipoprotein export system ATPase subunit